MRLPELDLELTAQAGPQAPLGRATLADEDALLALAAAARQRGGRLAALWGQDRRRDGGGFALEVVLGLAGGHAWLTLELDAAAPAVADLSGIFPAAARLQRAARDLVGIEFRAADPRPWLRHGAWPADWHPLRHDAGAGLDFANARSDYAFVRLAGAGAHEVPVGPIHAGTIEPGHFRFSVAGERVLRLEQRLGYAHKGVEKLFIGQNLAEGARLAGRLCGDSTCAYAWAYAAALEAACAAFPSARALKLRALILERERIANHLGDLGGIGNDAGLAFSQTQFSRLREDWLRLNARLFGHRLMMDAIVPGGVARELPAGARDAILAQGEAIELAVQRLDVIFDDHASLQDRLVGTGQIDADLARELSMTGLAARATGLALDTRVARADYTPAPPWPALAVSACCDPRGDVAARVAVRFAEIYESLRLQRELLAQLDDDGPLRVELPPRAGGAGLGVIEGWRGEVLFAVRLDAAGRLARAHPHDPSWQAWPAVERVAVRDIIPDFPLINKSFNLAYSGVDL